MNNETGLNSTLFVPTEIFGISGNFLAIIIFLAGIVIAFTMYGIVKWLKKKVDTTESRIDDIILTSIGIPAVIAVLVISFFVSLQVANLPPQIQGVVESNYFEAVYVIIGAWVVSGFVHNFINIYGSHIARKAGGDIDGRMVTIALTISKYVIWFAAFLLILIVLDIDITAFLAGAGIVGIAIGLAAQDFLSNLLGGAVIAVDKPFELYDRITIDQYTGDVMHVGSRSTRLKTLDNQIVTIPNSTVTKSFVVNYSTMDSRRKIRIDVRVAYGTDVQRVKKILNDIVIELAERIPFILSDPEPEVYFLEFGESSLKFQLVLWSSDVRKSWEVTDAVNMMIVERFTQEEIEIPVPWMDVRIRDSNSKSNL